MRLLILCLLLAPLWVRAAELRIATAANFYPTLLKLKQAFEPSSKDKITIVRGSSGKLYAQIMRGAPYDLFFSADEARADQLVRQGKSLDGKSRVYALGQLALWKADADSSLQLREQLESGQFDKLAIANPRTAPYGRAAIQALRALELYPAIKPKLVYGENVAQTLQFVQSGAADLGLVALALVNNDIYWQVEAYMHQPIKQKMLILKQSKQPQLAEKFSRFIQGPRARQIIAADGYLLEKAPRTE